jgi:hypothetical protein
VGLARRAVKPSLCAASGVARIPGGPPFGGEADLPRSCPFGAELGTETPHAGKSLLPLCPRGGDLGVTASLDTRRTLAGS